jgi:predicted metal-dependent hydrolase
MSLTQEQKDTIREFKERIAERFGFTDPIAGFSKWNYAMMIMHRKKVQIEMYDLLVDVISAQLDQAYQQGAKDKVEEIVEHFIENWKEFNKLSPSEIRKIFKLKDNT